MSNIISQVQHAVQEMDGLERAAFSLWALGSVIFWAGFVYFVFLIAKDFFGKLFKKAA
jgi:hypothetical protein